MKNKIQLLIPEWFKDARCANEEHPDADWFGTEKPESKTVKRAKEICMTCPVREQCLKHAAESPHSWEWGVYGGTTGVERKGKTVEDVLYSDDE